MATTSLPSGYVIVLTHVLPDGLGDLTFGESAVLELRDVAPVAWIRCYTNEESTAAGERLVKETASSCPFSLVCASKGSLADVLDETLENVWTGARTRFLAPWIFGLSSDEDALLKMAERHRTMFFALTEYGRGMGNIHTYTGGLGVNIPTGWVIDGSPGGVFRSVRRAPRTDTDWRSIFAERLGVSRSDHVRLWWFYSRRDDEKKHDFCFLDDTSSLIREVSKIIPVNQDGSIRLGHEKTNGEKLAAELFHVASDPTYKPNTDVACAEVSSGLAGQLSQFLWVIAFSDSSVGAPKAVSGEVVDVVVTPNLLTEWRENLGGTWCAAKVVQFDLVSSRETREARLPRPVYVCSSRIPRHEMRTFLEQCEEHVFTTGDQSLAEAVFLGKNPCIRPDAKVQQWEQVVLARALGALDNVPDLGDEMRRLVTDERSRELAERHSKRKSDEIEKSVTTHLGVGPKGWTPTHWVLVRAGMFG